MTTLEWKPPLNLEAENTVLGCLLIDSGQLAAVRDEGLLASDFTRDSHGQLFAMIEEMTDNGGTADIVTISPRLVGHSIEQTCGCSGPEFLISLMEAVASPARAADYAKLVHDAANATCMGKTLVQALATLSSYTQCGPDVLPKVEAQVANLIGYSSASQGLLSASQIMPRVVAEVDAAQLPGAQSQRLVTGWIALDQTLGSLRPGSMVVVAARPSQGKSSLATSLMRQVAMEQDRGVALVTVEVSAEDALRNLACCDAKVDGQALMSGSLQDDQFSRFTESQGRVHAAPIHVMDHSRVTAVQIRGLARRAAAVHGVELLIVDYLQLLSPSDRRDQNREREVARMSADLKAAARDAGIAVLVLSQLNRAVENRQSGRPNLSDLRDSGAIEQDADVVILLHTEETRQSEDHGPIDCKVLNVAKNRNGRTGEVRLAFHRQWTRFGDMAGFNLLAPDEEATGARSGPSREYGKRLAAWGRR